MHKTFLIRLNNLSIGLVLLSAIVQLCSVTNRTFAQEGASPSTTLGIKFSLDVDSRFGSRTYLPGQWGEFFLRLENAGNEPKDLLCTSYFDGLSALQFGRKIWLPAHSQLILSHPVLVPAAEQFPKNRATVQSLIVDDSQGKEVFVKNRSGQLRHERTLLVSATDRITGIVTGWGAPDALPQEALDLIVASRVYKGLDQRVTALSGQFLPADDTSLKYLDHLILAENRLVDDLAALTAVRRWLYAGGRLWVMLDRADPLLLERLFGDDFQGTVIDRVGLTSVRVDQPPSTFVPDGQTGEVIEYEEPVEMARMTATGVNILNTVNGWPAALTKSFGSGRVLITTLGPRGWIKPRSKEASVGAPGSRSEFVLRSPMEDIAPWILGVRESEPLPPKALELFAKEHISYKVPTGTLIIGSMCGFLFLLILTGTGLWR